MKVFLLVLFCAWMEFPRSIYGMWFLKYCTLLYTNQYRETYCVTRSKQENAPTPEGRNTPTEMILNYASLNQPSIQGNLCNNEQSGKSTKTRTKKHSDRESDELSTVDHDATNAKPSIVAPCFPLLKTVRLWSRWIFEGRSPTMRHVSRTHKVALDWLFHRINLDPKIQIKNVDTKNQLADILTKGSFIRNEWNHLLRLFNIMNISMFSRSHVSPIKDPQAVSKRQIHEGRPREDERVVAKWKTNVDFSVADCRSVSKSTGFECISQPGDTRCETSTGRLVVETTQNPIATRLSHQNLTISRNNVDHFENVYFEHTTKPWSSTGRRHARDRRQRGDLGNIYVRNTESSGTTWTRLSR